MIKWNTFLEALGLGLLILLLEPLLVECKDLLEIPLLGLQTLDLLSSL